MDKWDGINRRLENAMLVTSRMQEDHAAWPKDHRQWLEGPTHVGVEHERRMRDHARMIEAH
jgi:hypothetical protein